MSNPADVIGKREIKFRGQDKYGEWHIGSLLECTCDGYKRAYIYDKTWDETDIEHGEQVRCEVKPETVVQFTGLKDKNGKEIYEGDIIKTQYVQSESNRIVKYTVTENFSGFGFLENLNTSEVIGNIFENANLLEK